MIYISDLQKKRAINIIWNSAACYDFQPDFKSYDRDGRANLYLNCIFGAARRHYDYDKFIPLFRTFEQYDDADTFEGLLWLGLENCVYQKELPDRPALAGLRRKYAEAMVKEYAGHDDFHLCEALTYAHFSRVLGNEPNMNGYDRKLLDELEFTPDMTTDDIVARTQELFTRWFQISTEERKKKKHSILTPALHKLSKQPHQKAKSSLRMFGLGLTEHPDNSYGGSGSEGQRQDAEVKTKMTAEELREFMETKYGKSMYPTHEAGKIERTICSGSHAMCHLLFTYGDRIDTSKVQNAFEALSRQREAQQIERNRTSYQEHLSQNRHAIEKLSEKIQNSILLHLQPAPVKSNSGYINGQLAWRAAVLNDGHVFKKSEQDDMGSLAVDILLDASTSQKNRQEIVSAQGYMIAESLTKCNIPCRVMSFCSMTGYTILRVFRDYDKPSDNKKIFEYVSNGCNRDGLAISAAHYLMNQSSYEHKLLIILSDVKPNDVVKIQAHDKGMPVPYENDAGITDTALQVRHARADGISVICVFTGDDEDLPSAKLVYGIDFARIQSLDMLADTVGKLIQNQIKNI